MAAALERPEDLFYLPGAHRPNTALVESDVSWAEAELGVRLPDEYIKLLRVQNGGYVRYGALSIEPTRGFPDGVYRFDSLAGIHRTHYSSITEKTGLIASHLEHDLPGLVALDGDGHWWLCLDYRAGRETAPRLTHIDWELNNEVIVAPDFATFVSELRHDCFEFVFAVDYALVEFELGSGLESLGWMPDRIPKRWRRSEWSDVYATSSAAVGLRDNRREGDVLFVGIDARARLLFLDVSKDAQESALGELSKMFGEMLALVHTPLWAALAK